MRLGGSAPGRVASFHGGAFGLLFLISGFGVLRLRLPAGQAGSRPGGRLTCSLLRQRKVKQKKGDPTVWVPTLRFGQLAVLEFSGVLLKLAFGSNSRNP